MRLFVAIRFEPAMEERFYSMVCALRARSSGGTFTRRENLHLTLAFLGETDNFQGAKRAVASVTGNPFPLRFDGLGCFRQKGGDLYWVGAEYSEPLERLQRSLTNALSGEGLRYDDKPFRPHITLGRRVVTLPGFDRDALSASLPEAETQIDSIALMESSRIQGKLTYTPRYLHKLRGPS